VRLYVAVNASICRTTLLCSSQFPQKAVISATNEAELNEAYASIQRVLSVDGVDRGPVPHDLIVIGLGFKQKSTRREAKGIDESPGGPFRCPSY
jgi:hypothetical protein